MKIMIIGGFLGSGKTTTLLNIGKHLSEEGHRIAIIVNEIGEVGVDGVTLSKSGIVTKELTSGCICCTLKFDMEQTIEALSEDFKPDTVIIEPTGLAFPKQIKEELELLKIPNLSFSPIVNIVDAPRFSAEMKQIPKFIVTQMEEAEILCINKIDIATPEQIATVKEMFKELNPNAIVLEFSAKTMDEKFQNLMDLLAGESGKTGISEEQMNSVEMSEVAAYSAEFAIMSHHLDSDEAERISKNILDEVKQKILKLNPDFIGHVKIALDYPETMMKASLTSSEGAPTVEVFEKEGPTEEYKLKFLSAITKIDKDELKEIVENAVTGNLEKENIEFKEIASKCEPGNVINLEL